MSQNLLFATNSNPDLAKSLTENKLVLGKCQVGRYADGEVMIKLDTNVKNENILVLGSSNPPAENLVELLSLINTIKINGAAKVTAVIPYYGYAKSDHTDRPGFPVNARLFANFLKEAGADQVISVNLHSQAVESFFTIPLVHLSAMPLLANHFKTLNIPNLAVATPDQGGADRAKEFAQTLGIDKVIIVEKYRPTHDVAKVVKVIDGAKGKNIILADDMIQTGNTLLAAAKALKDLGALDIYVAATHLVYTGPPVANLSKSDLIKQVVVTNTIPTPKEVTLPEKFHVLDISPLLASRLTT